MSEERYVQLVDWTGRRLREAAKRAVQRWFRRADREACAEAQNAETLKRRERADVGAFGFGVHEVTDA